MYYKRLQQKALKKLRTKPSTPLNALLDLHIADAYAEVACRLQQELMLNMCGLDDPVVTQMLQRIIDEKV